MSNSPKKIGFFIASGCSIPSGQPSVAEISGNINNLKLHLYESLDPYCMFAASLEGSRPVWASMEEWAGDIPTVEHINPGDDIRCLINDVVQLDLWGRKPHYEQISSLLRHVAAVITQRYDDPLTSAFLDKFNLLDRLASLRFPTGHRFHSEPVANQLTIVDDYIGAVISRTIKRRPRLRGYQALVHAVVKLSREGHKVHFATTNYDTNVERLLRTNKIPFTDGFLGGKAEDQDGNAWRLGRGFEFDFEQGTAAVLKIHGSINWYTMLETDGDGGTFGISPEKLSPFQAQRQYVTRVEEQPFKRLATYTALSGPELLRGSMTKPIEYLYSVTPSLVYEFDRFVRSMDIIVVAGYGWGDEGVSQRLLGFAHEKGKQLIVVDGSQPYTAMNNCAGFDRSMVDKSIAGYPIELIRRYISDMPKTILLRELSKQLAKM